MGHMGLVGGGTGGRRRTAMPGCISAAATSTTPPSTIEPRSSRARRRGADRRGTRERERARRTRARGERDGRGGRGVGKGGGMNKHTAERFERDVAGDARDGQRRDALQRARGSQERHAEHARQGSGARTTGAAPPRRRRRGRRRRPRQWSAPPQPPPWGGGGSRRALRRRRARPPRSACSAPRGPTPSLTSESVSATREPSASPAAQRAVDERGARGARREVERHRPRTRRASARPPHRTRP